MKKRVLSLLLVVAMMASLVVLPVNAAEGDPGYCPYCKKDIPAEEWKTWGPDMDRKGGHYRLEEDLVTDQMNFGTSADKNNYCLDLNGHIWRAAKTNEAGANQLLLNIGTTTNTVVFSVFDSSAAKTGEMQAYGNNNSAGVVIVNNGATFNLYSGTIRQLYAADVSTAFGAMYVMKSTFNMYGGKITDGYNANSGAATNGAIGAGLTIRSTSTVTMSGGEITNCRSLYSGSGVCVWGGTFTMTGGKIHNNATDVNGGNIYVGASGRAILKDNAVVKNGVAGGVGANVYNAGTLRLENISVNGFTGAAPADADVKVDGDIYTANTKNANITLVGEVDISMGNSNGILVQGGSNATSLIKFENFDAANSLVYVGVDWAETDSATQVRRFTDNIDPEVVSTYAASFRPVGGSYDLIVNTGTDGTKGLRVKRTPASGKSYCPHCNGQVTWKDPTTVTNNALTAGHYMLQADHALTTNWQVAPGVTSSTTVAFNLNGHKVTANCQVFNFEGEGIRFSVMDTTGGGSVTTSVNNTATAIRGGIIDAYRLANGSTNIKNSRIYVYSGTYEMTDSGKVNAGGIISMNEGIVYVYGGILKNGKTSGLGGNIWMNTGVTNISITGGLITGGNAGTGGGNLFVNTGASATISGGIFENGTATQGGGNIDMKAGKDSTIKNALFRGGRNTGAGSSYAGSIAIRCAMAVTFENVTIANGTSANVGGNIGISDAATVTMNNVAVIDGEAAKHGGNIFVGAAATINATNLISLGGTTAVSGGGLAVGSNGTAVAANITLTNSHFVGGTADCTGTTAGNLGNGGNIYSSGATLVMDNCGIVGGNAIGNGKQGSCGNGGNIYVEKSASLEMTDCTVAEGFAKGGGGNMYIRNNNTFAEAVLTNCVVKNGTCLSETSPDDISMSDNIFTGVGVVLDGTEIYGCANSDYNGTGLYARNSGTTHKETIYITLKGDTKIGSTNSPYNGSLQVYYGTYPAELKIESSFTGFAVLSPDGLNSFTPETETDANGKETTTYVSNFDPNAVYGTALGYASCEELNGTLYIGNHTADTTTVYEYCMPKVDLVDGQLVVEQAGAGVKTSSGVAHYTTIADAIDAYDASTAKAKVLKLTAADVSELALNAGEYYLDINGNDVTVTGADTIYGIDSKNNNHDESAIGSLTTAAKVKAAATDEDGDAYIKTVNENGAFEFHHISMDIKSVVLRTSNAGVYYKGIWECDETLRAHLEAQGAEYYVEESGEQREIPNVIYGVVASIQNMPANGFDKDLDKNGNNHNCWSYFAGTGFEPGKTVIANGALVQGIMKTVQGEETLDSRKATNAENCEIPVYAKAYLMVTEDDGKQTYIVGKTGADKSLMDMFVQLDKVLDASVEANAANLALMSTFYNNWKDLGLTEAIAKSGHTFENIFQA